MLRSAQEAVLSVNEEIKKAVVIQPAENRQNIPFLDQKDLFTILSRHASLKDMGRLRRTCRAAYHRFDDQATAEPMRMLELVEQLDITALDKFTKNNAALIESWRENAPHNHAAYAAYALLGDVSKLYLKNLSQTIEWLGQQNVSTLIVDCVSLLKAVDHTFKDYTLLSETLDTIASHYMTHPRLGEIRPILLHFLFRATRLLEEVGDRSLDDRYNSVRECLRLANDHNLFAMHRNQNVFGVFAMFGGGTGLTTSQQSIQNEIEKVEKRYEAIPKYSKPNYDN